MVALLSSLLAVRHNLIRSSGRTRTQDNIYSRSVAGLAECILIRIASVCQIPHKDSITEDGIVHICRITLNC
jgi:hypothetical protein